MLDQPQHVLAWLCATVLSMEPTRRSMGCCCRSCCSAGQRVAPVAWTLCWAHPGAGRVLVHIISHQVHRISHQVHQTCRTPLCGPGCSVSGLWQRPSQGCLLGTSSSTGCAACARQQQHTGSVIQGTPSYARVFQLAARSFSPPRQRQLLTLEAAVRLWLCCRLRPSLR